MKWFSDRFTPLPWWTLDGLLILAEFASGQRFCSLWATLLPQDATTRQLYGWPSPTTMTELLLPWFPLPLQREAVERSLPGLEVLPVVQPCVSVMLPQQSGEDAVIISHHSTHLLTYVVSRFCFLLRQTGPSHKGNSASKQSTGCLFMSCTCILLDLRQVIWHIFYQRFV